MSRGLGLSEYVEESSFESGKRSERVGVEEDGCARMFESESPS